VYDLSKELVGNKNNYRLITGFGKGIGSSVINGVLSHVFSTKYQHLDESIIMRPFPQLVPPGADKKQLWTDYRSDIVAEAGIAVFMFGNRLTDGQVMESAGVMEEFELAVSKGALPIPIGATGYAAETIWQLVSQDLPKYGYVNSEMQQAFMALNDRTKSPKELINAVEKIVNLCQ
jgi:Sir2- and TIR-associating SLOG family